MSLPRVEINLRRLLSKCELMIKGNQKEDDRFPKYIDSLEGMLKELKCLPDGVSTESLKDYNRRLINLRVACGLPTPELEDKLELKGSFGNVLTAERNREELLGLRQRSIQKVIDTNSIDDVINYHQDIQDKIAGEMLELTRTLKEQSEIANKIIKKDTQIANRSGELSDHNLAKLKVESAKLEEHSKGACRCWMWIILVFVAVVFINMIFFMKITRKS